MPVPARRDRRASSGASAARSSSTPVGPRSQARVLAACRARAAARARDGPSTQPVAARARREVAVGQRGPSRCARGSTTQSSPPRARCSREPASTGSGIAFEWPCDTTGLDPISTSSVERSWSQIGVRPDQPPTSSATSGFDGVSIVVAVYFCGEPSTRRKRSAARRPALSNAEPLARYIATPSGPVASSVSPHALRRGRRASSSQRDLARPLDHRMVEAPWVVVERRQRPTLRAGVAPRQRMVGVAAHPHDALALERHDDAAHRVADPAEAAAAPSDDRSPQRPPTSARTAASSSAWAQSASWRTRDPAEDHAVDHVPERLHDLRPVGDRVVADRHVEDRVGGLGHARAGGDDGRIQRVHRPHQRAGASFVLDERLDVRADDAEQPFLGGGAPRRAGQQPLAPALHRAEVGLGDQLILRAAELVDRRHRHPAGLGELAHRHRVVAVERRSARRLHQPFVSRVVATLGQVLGGVDDRHLAEGTPGCGSGDAPQRLRAGPRIGRRRHLGAEWSRSATEGRRPAARRARRRNGRCRRRSC